MVILDLSIYGKDTRMLCVPDNRLTSAAMMVVSLRRHGTFHHLADVLSTRFLYCQDKIPSWLEKQFGDETLRVSQSDEAK